MKAIDITGQKFGRLMALNLDCSEPKKKERRWICVCECGQKKSINQHKLTRGNTKSCGCLIQKKNILGEMFGKLLAIRPEETSISSRKPKWICRCECGKIKTVSRSNLVSGHTKSCGCLFGNYDEKISEKFFIKENGCWEWISGVGGNGYGIISIEGKSKIESRSDGRWSPPNTLGHACRRFAARHVLLFDFPGTCVPGYRLPSLRD